MSAGTERVFTPLLREVGQGLRMPLPAQTRILRELEGDLQALTAQFVADGVEPTEARNRAMEALVPDTQTVSALGHIHQTWYRKITQRLPAERVLRLERHTLKVCTALLLGVEGVLLVGTDLLAYASVFLWPVLALGSLNFALVLWKGFELWVKRDHTRMRARLDGILGLSFFTLLVGITGAVIDLSRMAATVEASPELAGTLVRLWLVRDVGLLAASIMLALTGALAWFVFTTWISHVEHAHQEIVGTTPVPNKE